MLSSAPSHFSVEGRSHSKQSQTEKGVGSWHGGKHQMARKHVFRKGKRGPIKPLTRNLLPWYLTHLSEWCQCLILRGRGAMTWPPLEVPSSQSCGPSDHIADTWTLQSAFKPQQIVWQGKLSLPRFHGSVEWAMSSDEGPALLLFLHIMNALTEKMICIQNSCWKRVNEALLMQLHVNKFPLFFNTVT